MFRSTVPVLLALALAACVGPARYQPMDDGIGYGQQRIEANRYRVWFAGNAYTPRETVEDYVLYRTAELTLEEGYDYFILSNRQTEGERRDRRGGVSFGFGGFGWGRHTGVGIGVATSPDNDRPMYYGQLDAILRKGAKPEDPQAFDARAVKENLEQRIDRG